MPHLVLARTGTIALVLAISVSAVAIGASVSWVNSRGIHMIGVGGVPVTVRKVN